MLLLLLLLLLRKRLLICRRRGRWLDGLLRCCSSSKMQHALWRRSTYILLLLLLLCRWLFRCSSHPLPWWLLLLPCRRLRLLLLLPLFLLHILRHCCNAACSSLPSRHVLVRQRVLVGQPSCCGTDSAARGNMTTQ
jgi:hypothetical protein